MESPGPRQTLSLKQQNSPPSPGLRIPSWIRALVSITLLGLLFGYLDFGRLLQILRGAQPALIGGLFVLLLLERVFSAYRWYVLLQGKAPAIAFRSVLGLTFISFFLGTFMPGAAAQLLRIYVMSRAISDLALAFSSVLVERLLAVFALFLLVSLGLLIAPPELPATLAYLAWLGLGAVIFVWLWLMLPVTRELTSHTLSGRWLLPLRTRLIKVYRHLDDYARQPFLILWAMLLAIAMQCLRVLSAYVGALALGIQVPVVTFAVLVLIVILVALLPISIGGIGVREAAFVFLLGFAGVSEEAAFGLSVLIYVLGLVTILPGALLWARSGWQSRKAPYPMKDQPIP